VSLFICSETLEHLDDPVTALQHMREKAEGLILTTPINAWEDTNKEHYWAWDRGGVEELLTKAGWESNVFVMLDSTVFNETYTYGIWGCK
jgi:phosphoserine aminotransferase